MAEMAVTVAYALPQRQEEITVRVPRHANVAIAIRASGILDRYSDWVLSELDVGVFSQRVQLDTPLSPGDRVEIYRPLEIDPMTRRRLRAQRAKKSTE